MLHVGVVGCGIRGCERIRAIQESGAARVTAVCDSAANRLYALRDRYPQMELCMDWRGLIRRNDVQLVVVASPSDTHFDIVRQAIQFGKHVLIEPPFAATTAQMTELVNIAHDKGVRLAVAYSDLFLPEIRALKEYFDNGDFGDLTFADAYRSSVDTKACEGTVLRDLASHDIAIMDYLTGRTPKGVLATGSCHSESGKVDVAYINLDYGDGLMANLHANHLTPINSHRFTIGGTLQFAVLDRSFLENVLFLVQGYPSTANAKVGRQGEVRIPVLETIDAEVALVQHLVESIDDGTDARIDAELALRISHVLDSSERSLYEDAGQVLKSRTVAAESVIAAGQRDAFDLTPSAPIAMETNAVNSPIDSAVPRR